MSLVICPRCGSEASDQAAVCPQCGAPRGAGWARPSSAAPAAAQRRTRIWPWVIGVPVVAFFGFGFYASSTPEGKEKARARDAISLCWDEQNRASLAPSSQRFIAGACEGMEADFERRFGTRP